MHDPASWKEILKKFRQACAVHDEAGYAIRFVSPVPSSVEGVRLVEICGDTEPKIRGAIFSPPGDSLKELRTLAATAWPHLSDEFGHDLNEWAAHIAPAAMKPSQRWILALFFEALFTQPDNSQSNFDVEIQPFEYSAVLIEKWQLCTEVPELPEWLGQRRGSGASDADCDKLDSQFPAFEPGNADWISSKVAADILRISTKRLSNLRHDKTRGCIKCKRGNERWGLHDKGLFWRVTGKEDAKYYLPQMKKHAGHLARTYPKTDLKRLQ
ncbi:MAG: hypothetical protein O3C40_09025 [Planctomycetota bacterium]|nr:hypothetical protein [Planctomycetota bacterium]